MERRTLQVGSAVILMALLLRLISGSVMETGRRFSLLKTTAKIMLFLETGRMAEAAPAPPPETAPQLPPDEETQPTEPVENRTPATFSPEDGSSVSLRNSADCSVDVTQALLTPLLWDLTEKEPSVLIVHTHSTESYVNTEGYTESSAYRTLDDRYNVISVGDRLAEELESRGISVIHDRTVHDYPSYNGSYNLARETIEEYLIKYPSISLVLDLHRDAATDGEGNQVAQSLSTGEGSAAKLMLVLGTDTAGLPHPNWQENFSLAVKLQAQLEKVQPGICRPMSLRSSRFNQDLTGGAVLVEMGAAGNTRQEALLSAKILAQAIADLAYGTAAPTVTS